MFDLEKSLLPLCDRTYQAFQARLIPNLPPQTILGVRTPELRAIARGMDEIDRQEFLQNLPHRYFEENQIHAFLLEREKDFEKAIACVEAFLPYVDNWATCDQLIPKVFLKHRTELLPHLRRWLASEHTYTVRFAIGMLMRGYLDDAFSPEYPALVSQAVCDEYYINMMVAWYFATALAKQYDSVIGYLSEHRLPVWVHNKTVQKSIESYRISDEKKQYLRTLRIKNK